MQDDWKGEHLIRGRKMTQAERVSIDMSAKSMVANRKRRRAGITPACKEQHDQFVRRVYRTMHQVERMATESTRTLRA